MKDRNEKPLTPLQELIPTKLFRIISSEQKNVPGGITETAVHIDLRPETLDEIKCPLPRSGQVFGWVRAGKSADSPFGRKRAELIELNDWGVMFMVQVTIEAERLRYYVSTEDVRSLLENCLKPEIIS